MFVFHCSTSHPPRPLRAVTLGVQAVDLSYFGDGPHRYRPAWRTVKLPDKTHGNKPAQPDATSPAGPGSQRGINQEMASCVGALATRYRWSSGGWRPSHCPNASHPTAPLPYHTFTYKRTTEAHVRTPSPTTYSLLVKRATVPRTPLLARMAQRQASICMHKMHCSNVKRRGIGEEGPQRFRLPASPASLLSTIIGRTAACRLPHLCMCVHAVPVICS